MPHSSEKGVSESEIRDAIYVRIRHGDPNLLPHDLPLSEEARSAVVLAREEADKLGDRHVRNEHLVLAVVKRENSHAAQWLGVAHKLRLQIRALTETDEVRVDQSKSKELQPKHARGSKQALSGFTGVIASFSSCQGNAPLRLFQEMFSYWDHSLLFRK